MKNKTTLYKKILVVSLFFILTILSEIHLLNRGIADLACILHLVALVCMLIALSLRRSLKDLVVNHLLLFSLHMLYSVVIAVFGFNTLITYRSPSWLGGFYRLGYILAIVGGLLAIVVSAFIQVSIKVIIDTIKESKKIERKEVTKEIDTEVNKVD